MNKQDLRKVVCAALGYTDDFKGKISSSENKCPEFSFNLEAYVGRVCIDYLNSESEEA